MPQGTSCPTPMLLRLVAFSALAEAVQSTPTAREARSSRHRLRPLPLTPQLARTPWRDNRALWSWSCVRREVGADRAFAWLSARDAYPGGELAQAGHAGLLW
jgi:hypothetical protein